MVVLSGACAGLDASEELKAFSKGAPTISWMLSQARQSLKTVASSAFAGALIDASRRNASVKTLE